MLKTRSIRTAVAAVSVVALWMSSETARADAPFFVGPAYDESTVTGYSNPSVPYLPGSPAGAGGLANPGKVAGGTDLGSRAFRWDVTGTLAELGGLGISNDGKTNIYAYAMNLSGLSAGFAAIYGTDGVPHGERAVRWNAGSTTAIELGNLGLDDIGNAFARAYAVNASGTTVGSASKPRTCPA